MKIKDIPFKRIIKSLFILFCVFLINTQTIALAFYKSGSNYNNSNEQILPNNWDKRIEDLSKLVSQIELEENNNEGTPAECGNGIIEVGESCDDGNTSDNDGCSSTCQIETNINAASPTPLPICGNGIIEVGESCDDGNILDNDGCSSTCQIESNIFAPNPTPAPFCGNGIIEVGESCDDGNTSDNDGCSSTCQNENNILNGNNIAEPKPDYITADDIIKEGIKEHKDLFFYQLNDQNSVRVTPSIEGINIGGVTKVDFLTPRLQDQEPEITNNHFFFKPGVNNNPQNPTRQQLFLTSENIYFSAKLGDIPEKFDFTNIGSIIEGYWFIFKILGSYFLADGTELSYDEDSTSFNNPDNSTHSVLLQKITKDNLKEKLQLADKTFKACLKNRDLPKWQKLLIKNQQCATDNGILKTSKSEDTDIKLSDNYTFYDLDTKIVTQELIHIFDSKPGFIIPTIIYFPENTAENDLEGRTVGSFEFKETDTLIYEFFNSPYQILKEDENHEEKDTTSAEAQETTSPKIIKDLIAWHTEQLEKNNKNLLYNKHFFSEGGDELKLFDGSFWINNRRYKESTINGINDINNSLDTIDLRLSPDFTNLTPEQLTLAENALISRIKELRNKYILFGKEIYKIDKLIKDNSTNTELQEEIVGLKVRAYLLGLRLLSIRDSIDSTWDIFEKILEKESDKNIDGIYEEFRRLPDEDNESKEILLDSKQIIGKYLDSQDSISILNKEKYKSQKEKWDKLIADLENLIYELKRSIQKEKIFDELIQNIEDPIYLSKYLFTPKKENKQAPLSFGVPFNLEEGFDPSKESFKEYIERIKKKGNNNLSTLEKGLSTKPETKTEGSNSNQNIQSVLRKTIEDLNKQINSFNENLNQNITSRKRLLYFLWCAQKLQYEEIDTKFTEEDSFTEDLSQLKKIKEKLEKFKIKEPISIDDYITSNIPDEQKEKIKTFFDTRRVNLSLLLARLELLKDLKELYPLIFNKQDSNSFTFDHLELKECLIKIAEGKSDLPDEFLILINSPEKKVKAYLNSLMNKSTSLNKLITRYIQSEQNSLSSVAREISNGPSEWERFSSWVLSPLAVLGEDIRSDQRWEDLSSKSFLELSSSDLDNLIELHSLDNLNSILTKLTTSKGTKEYQIIIDKYIKKIRDSKEILKKAKTESESLKKSILRIELSLANFHSELYVNSGFDIASKVYILNIWKKVGNRNLKELHSKLYSKLNNSWEELKTNGKTSKLDDLLFINKLPEARDLVLNSKYSDYEEQGNDYSRILSELPEIHELLDKAFEIEMSISLIKVAALFVEAPDVTEKFVAISKEGAKDLKEIINDQGFITRAQSLLDNYLKHTIDPQTKKVIPYTPSIPVSLINFIYSIKSEDTSILCDKVLSELSVQDFKTWASKELPRILVGLALSVLAVLMICPVTGPLALVCAATVGTAVFMLGYELTGEIEYYLFDIGKGSTFGQWARDEYIIDQNGQPVKMEFLEHVLKPYAIQFIVGTVLCLVTMGLGKLFCGWISKLTSSASEEAGNLIAKEANRKAFENVSKQLATRAQDYAKSKVSNSLADRFKGHFFKKWLEEYLEELSEELVLEPLSDILVVKGLLGIDGNIKFAGDVIEGLTPVVGKHGVNTIRVTDTGIKNNSNPSIAYLGNNKAQVDQFIKALISENIKVISQNDNGTIEAEINGRKVQFEPEAVDISNIVDSELYQTVLNLTDGDLQIIPSNDLPDNVQAQTIQESTPSGIKISIKVNSKFFPNPKNLTEEQSILLKKVVLEELVHCTQPIINPKEMDYETYEAHRKYLEVEAEFLALDMVGELTNKAERAQLLSDIREAIKTKDHAKVTTLTSKYITDADLQIFKQNYDSNTEGSNIGSDGNLKTIVQTNYSSTNHNQQTNSDLNLLNLLNNLSDQEFEDLLNYMKDFTLPDSIKNITDEKEKAKAIDELKQKVILISSINSTNADLLIQKAESLILNKRKSVKPIKANSLSGLIQDLFVSTSFLYSFNPLLNVLGDFINFQETLEKYAIVYNIDKNSKQFLYAKQFIVNQIKRISLLKEIYAIELILKIGKLTNDSAMLKKAEERFEKVKVELNEVINQIENANKNKINNLNEELSDGIKYQYNDINDFKNEYESVISNLKKLLESGFENKSGELYTKIKKDLKTLIHLNHYINFKAFNESIHMIERSSQFLQTKEIVSEEMRLFHELLMNPNIDFKEKIDAIHKYAIELAKHYKIPAEAIPREMFFLKILPIIDNGITCGQWDRTTLQLILNPNSTKNLALVLSHELNHFYNSLRLTILNKADPNKYAELLWDDYAGTYLTAKLSALTTDGKDINILINGVETTLFTEFQRLSKKCMQNDFNTIKDEFTSLIQAASIDSKSANEVFFNIQKEFIDLLNNSVIGEHHLTKYPALKKYIEDELEKVKQGLSPTVTYDLIRGTAKDRLEGTNQKDTLAYVTSYEEIRARVGELITQFNSIVNSSGSTRHEAIKANNTALTKIIEELNKNIELRKKVRPVLDAVNNAKTDEERVKALKIAIETIDSCLEESNTNYFAPTFYLELTNIQKSYRAQLKTHIQETKTTTLMDKISSIFEKLIISFQKIKDLCTKLSSNNETKNNTYLSFSITNPLEKTPILVAVAPGVENDLALLSLLENTDQPRYNDLFIAQINIQEQNELNLNSEDSIKKEVEEEIKKINGYLKELEELTPKDEYFLLKIN